MYLFYTIFSHLWLFLVKRLRILPAVLIFSKLYLFFRYWEALQALVNGVLNKIQFQHNKAQLQHLDNDVCDDDVSIRLIQLNILFITIFYFLQVFHYFFSV